MLSGTSVNLNNMSEKLTKFRNPFFYHFRPEKGQKSEKIEIVLNLNSSRSG